MRRVFAGVLSLPLALLTVNSQASRCTLRSEMLRGAWIQSNRAGFFEQMEFSSEGHKNLFNSWLHERPEISNATWTLENCVLRITKQEDSSFSFVYGASIRSGRLELRETGQPVARYRRIPQ